jgi:hypothetical protein
VLPVPDDPMPLIEIGWFDHAVDASLQILPNNVALPIVAADGTQKYLATQMVSGAVNPNISRMNTPIDYNARLNTLAYAIALWSLTCKPFKPILGETSNDTNGFGTIGGGLAA